MEIIVQARGLTKTYTRADGTPVQAVKGIDLDIRRGEIFSLLGPNGAGKSTTISMISGLIPPTSGDATIGDAIGSELILKYPGKLRALVGADHPGIEQIDDIDDVRPVYAVPAWVRQQSVVRKELLRPMAQVW